MTTQEHKFCNAKGEVVVFDLREILKTMKSQQRLTIENIFNAITVAKECVFGKADSWLVRTEAKPVPIALTIPLSNKRTLSEKDVKLMVECYAESAEDDLALAEECEGMTVDIDADSNR